VGGCQRDFFASDLCARVVFIISYLQIEINTTVVEQFNAFNFAMMSNTINDIPLRQF